MTARLRPVLSMELLGDRITPVVGAFDQARVVNPGEGYDGVVYIVANGGGAGTGELLPDGRSILTAAHVVTPADSNLPYPNGVAVSFDMPNVGRITYNVPAANIVVHPGWNNNGVDDLAVVTLPSIAPSGPGPQGAERYPLYRNGDEVGRDITIVGYGSFGTGTTGEQPPDGLNKRIANNRYDTTGDQFGFDSLLYDVDNGTAANDAFGRILGVNQTGVPNEGTGARGDSGGPVFVTINGRLFIAGTTTSGPGPQNPPNPAVANPNVLAGTGSISLDTRISQYAGWIDGILGRPHAVVLDLRLQVVGQDNAPDAVARVVNGNLEVWVNGNLIQNEPLAAVTGITLIGAGADADPFTTTVIIDASVPQALPITFQRVLQVTDQRTNVVQNPAANAPALPAAPVPALPDARPQPAFNLAAFPNALNPSRLTAVGAGAGGSPRVQLLETGTGQIVGDFLAYSAAFTGGVRTAVGDVTGDFVDDIVTVPGAGGGPNVKVFDGATGVLIRSFLAFGPGFTGGLNVACGDVDGDGLDDIVVAAAATGGPRVIAFSGADNTVLYDFYAYAPGFTGGVNVTVADINDDGFADIVTGAGSGAPHVKAFSGENLSLLRSFYAYPATFTGGVFVAAGDLDGDFNAEIVTAPGAGGGPNVRVFDGLTNNLKASFNAYDGGFGGGVRVAVADADSDGLSDLVTGTGPGVGGQVKVFGGQNFALRTTVPAFGGVFAGGVFLGGIG